MTPNAAQSDARSAIFASIRENLTESIPFNATHDEHPKPPGSSMASIVTAVGDSGDLLETFGKSLEIVGATCTFIESENGAADRLVVIVKELAAAKIAISDSELVRRIVKTAGIDTMENASRDELFSSEIGITSAQWGIAETGTLVLESGAERHRLVSLVPPVHVCVLTAGSIRQSMAEILEVADTDANATITFVTGASRTSDIELTLAIGVHGPGELHVIVITSQ